MKSIFFSKKILLFYQAEEVNIKGRVYHKKCLSCKNCKRPIDISLLAIGPDDDIYCEICCVKISWPGNYAGASDTTLIPGDDGEPTNCPRCNGKVCNHSKKYLFVDSYCSDLQHFTFFNAILATRWMGVKSVAF